jgi:hypothetical protein
VIYREGFYVEYFAVLAFLQNNIFLRVSAVKVVGFAGVCNYSQVPRPARGQGGQAGFQSLTFTNDSQGGLGPFFLALHSHPLQQGLPGIALQPIGRANLGMFLTPVWLGHTLLDDIFSDGIYVDVPVLQVGQGFLDIGFFALDLHLNISEPLADGSPAYIHDDVMGFDHGGQYRLSHLVRGIVQLNKFFNGSHTHLKSLKSTSNTKPQSHEEKKKLSSHKA